MKKTIFLTALLVFTLQSYAQRNNVKQALKAINDYDITTAKEAIDKATLHPKTSAHWETWKIKGDVYKALLERANVKELANKAVGREAFDAYSKALTISKVSQHKDLNKQLSELRKTVLNIGVSFLTIGNDTEALKRFKLGIVISDTIGEESGDFYAMIANIHMQDARFLAAAEAYMECVEQGYDVEQQMNNALAALSLGGSSKYEEVLLKYRVAYPNNTKLKINEANHRIGQGDYDHAIPLLEELVAEHPLNTDYRYALGTAFLDIQNSKGIEHIQVKLKEDPNHLLSLQALGVYYLNKAVATNQQLNRLDQVSTEAIQMEKERNDLLKEVVVYMERAVKLDGKNKLMLTALSNAYNILGDTENHRRVFNLTRALKN